MAITNSGGAALHVSSALMSGANSGDFSFNNGCTAAAYAVNTACIIGVTFTPPAIGTRAATLTITDDAPNSPQTVQLSGLGAGTPSVTLSSTAVSFAATALGTTSPRQNITVTNLGAAALHFSSIKLSGTNPGDFTLINECVTSAYPINTACTVGLTFTPSGTGARTATVTIADDAPPTRCLRCPAISRLPPVLDKPQRSVCSSPRGSPAVCRHVLGRSNIGNLRGARDDEGNQRSLGTLRYHRGNRW